MIKGLTQNEIAKRMGDHQPNVSAWLSGKRIPSEQSLLRLSRAMGMEPDELIAMIWRRRRKLKQ